VSNTAQDIINGALRFISAIAAGETPATAESTDALLSLNEVIASLSAEEVYLYSRVTDTLALTINDNSYLWGTGAGAGNLATARPLRLLEASCTANNVSLPVDIVSVAEYNAISDFTATSNYVSKLYLDNAYPTANMNVWPKPAATSTLTLYSLKPLTGFAALTDTFDFPPGYERAIKLQLAVDLAPEYGRPITPEMFQLAMQAKAALRALNKQNALGLDLQQSPLASANDAQAPSGAANAPQGANQ
jgi:hypothetical protein